MVEKVSGRMKDTMARGVAVVEVVEMSGVGITIERGTGIGMIEETVTNGGDEMATVWPMVRE